MQPPEEDQPDKDPAADAPPQQSRTLDVPVMDIYSPEGETPAHEPLDPRSGLIPVVGLGGSAGSVEALQTFFSSVEQPTGCAFVVVVHLSAEHESSLAAIIQRCTKMSVRQVEGAIPIEVDHVYVISPGKHLAMSDGILRSTEMVRSKGRHVTVDLFFRTLAETHGVRATAIVLSGGDGDGAIGLKRVKERGGLTLCQDPTEAEQDGMPREAIATGMVDLILPVAQMPARVKLFHENGAKLMLPSEASTADRQAHDERPPEHEEASLREILAFLRTRAGHDFGYYKRATILRRIARRMQVNGVQSLTDYINTLRTLPGETGALLQDLLISVTNFFRDKRAFAALEAKLPELFRGKESGDQVRVWVAGCATGEEAYSIAMLLCEHANTMHSPPAIQIFATDLDQTAINIAREGRYPVTISADVSEDRLKEYFSKDNGGYRVRRVLRETVLFAYHDLLKDSPFSRLDLVSCRNLLIYLNRGAQARAFDIFHFALSPGGYLFLGSSESAEDVNALFTAIDKKQRLYMRRPVQRIGLSVPTGAATLSFAYQNRNTPAVFAPPALATVNVEAIGVPLRNTWGELHDRFVRALAPPSVIVSRDYDIVHISAAAGKFLRLTGGEASMNLLRLAHPELKTELRAGLFRATRNHQDILLPAVTVEIDGIRRWVEISIQFADEIASDFLLVTFHLKEFPVSKGDSDQPSSARLTDAELLRQLEEEVDQLRAGWKETVEQYEASTEELKASNEELQAMNEELRSATEEMETGREELQSINEEITTINQELKSKVEQLGRANSDLQNLMSSTKIATIFLNRQLRINRFTPTTTGIFNFIPSDIGRPLSDLTHRLEYPQITADAEQVLEHLTPVEREVRDKEGHWYLARILPYRTTEDQIAGVVITCVNITERKEAEEARKWLSDIVEAANDAIISFDMTGKIISWNRGAELMFGYAPQEMKGKAIHLLTPPERTAEDSTLLTDLASGDPVSQFETIRLRKDGSPIDVSLSASPMLDEAGHIVGATAIAQDITVRKRAIEDLLRARGELEMRVHQRTAELDERLKQLARLSAELTSTEQRERQRLSYVLHDQLQQVLVSAKMRIEALRTDGAELDSTDADKLLALLDEALANSRSLAIELAPPVLQECLGNALEWLCSTWVLEKYDIIVTAKIDAAIDARDDDMRVLVFHAVKELLFNIVKHAGTKHAEVTLTTAGKDDFEITVRDHGVGMSPPGKSNGSCMGLAGLNQRLHLLGGSFKIQKGNGGGTLAVIRAPRALTPPKSRKLT